MEGKYIWTLLVAITLITIVFASSLVVGNYKLQDEIDALESDVSNLEDGLFYWRDMYMNNPKIVTETEYVYINDTEYIVETITETIWNNHTIYLDNIHCDVTGNGVVDYNDVCTVLHYVNNGLSLIEESFYNKYSNPYEILYDVNRDGKVNTNDVELILDMSY